jgi:hypothetical protein
MAELARWDTFYVIVGTAAGTLIGLQFIVMTLIAQRPPAGAADAGAAFATPAVVHFTSVLFLAALIRPPWPRLRVAIVVDALIGVYGVTYTTIVARRMKKQTVYQPVFEDWLFHAVLPLVAYGALVASPFIVSGHTIQALFTVAGSALLLLFIGIHNTWDGLEYHVFIRMRHPTTRPLTEVSKQEAGAGVSSTGENV